MADDKKETKKDDKETKSTAPASTENKDEKKTDPTPPKEEETVAVSKSTLEAILAKQEAQEETIGELKKDNEKLNKIADKSRLAWWDSQHSEELISTFRVGVFTDYDDTEKDGTAKKKIVLGWKMIRDEVRFENGVLKENQIFKLYLDEGEGNEPSEKEVNIIVFTRELERLIGELVEESKTNEGVFKTLRFEDGRVIKFDARFLNP